MEKVILNTKDGVDIHGNYLTAGKKAPAVLLLHMMPKTKESWSEFQEKLSDAGFSSLAIDQRGHGESVLRLADKKWVGINYENFTDKEQQEKINDIEASVDFLLGTGIELKDISLAGASIGANLSLWYQSSHPEVKTSILLSPGLVYRGVSTDDKIKALKSGQSVLLASGGTEFDGYSRETVQKLHQLANVKRDIKIFEGAKHGTSMLKSHPEFMGYIINWLKDIYLS